MNDFSCSTIKKILTEFVSLGGKRIDVTGGEILTRKDINEIMSIAKGLHIKTEGVTNASLLTDEILKFWKATGVEAVAISLDGHTSETYNHIRRQNNEVFKKVLENIHKCAAMGFNTKVNTVVFSSNLNIMEDILRLSIDLGANEHGFYFFSTVGSGEKFRDEVADPEEWLRIIRTKLWKYRDLIKISLEVPLIETTLAEKLNIGCFMQNPWHLQLLPNGNVYPCAIMAAYDHPIGDIYNSTLAQLWNDPGLRSGEYYRRYIAPRIKQFGSCVDYPNFTHLLKSDAYQFVCLCTKFKIEELMI
jgi:MoaA/NifB/PqqE/SkfB family radical SAM enzyme